MNPPAGFVQDLRGYDPLLRVRWGEHSARWFIERKLRERSPQWLREKPSPWKSQRGLDLWDGWREGYVHVLTVHRDLLTWALVVPHLAAADLQVRGGIDAMNQALDDAEAAWERETDRTIENFQEAAGKEAFDRLKWLTGQRVAVPEAVTDGAA